MAFAMQLVPLVNGVVRLYEQAAHAPLGDADRVMHLVLVALVAALAALSTAPWRTAGLDNGPSSSAARSAWKAIDSGPVSTWHR